MSSSNWRQNPSWQLHSSQGSHSMHQSTLNIRHGGRNEIGIPNLLSPQQPTGENPSAPSTPGASSSQYWDTVLDPLSINNNPRRHSDTATPPTPCSSRECPTCKERFPSVRLLEDHILSECGSDGKIFTCKQCGAAFKKNSNLAKHKKLVHLGEKNFPCPESGCNRLFGQRSNLNSHIKAVHLGEKPFVCPDGTCDRRFSQKSGLKAHIKTVHNGERPYVCECGSSFGHRGDVSKQVSLFSVPAPTP